MEPFDRDRISRGSTPRSHGRRFFSHVGWAGAGGFPFSGKSCFIPTWDPTTRGCLYHQFPSISGMWSQELSYFLVLLPWGWHVPNFSDLDTLGFIHLLPSLCYFVEILNMWSSALLFLSWKFCLLLTHFFCLFSGFMGNNSFRFAMLNEVSAKASIFGPPVMPQSSPCWATVEYLPLTNCTSSALTYSIMSWICIQHPLWDTHICPSLAYLFILFPFLGRSIPYPPWTWCKGSNKNDWVGLSQELEESTLHLKEKRIGWASSMPRKRGLILPYVIMCHLLSEATQRLCTTTSHCYRLLAPGWTFIKLGILCASTYWPLRNILSFF